MGMQENTLTVGLNDRAYDIVIGPDLIDRAGEALGPIVANRHIVIISDKNVAKLHLTRLKASFKSFARKVDHIAIVAGEASKSMAMLSHLLDDILALGVDRSVLLVAFGGGVVGDLAGFAAASLLRGVDFIQIPTTLLAQVDSSVGGKTGVNTAAGKNLIGAFYNPKGVLIDTAALNTLTKREFKAGLAEVIKYALIQNKTLFSLLKKYSLEILSMDHRIIEEMIFLSVQTKAKIVTKDEKENGIRAILNFGHTFGHAIEAHSKYRKILHGEAVAKGMKIASKISYLENLISLKEYQEVVNLLQLFEFDLSLEQYKYKELKPYVLRDKKIKEGKLNLVLLNKISNAIVTNSFDAKNLQRGLQD